MKTAKTALHKLRSLTQGTSRIGIVALFLLGTSAFVAHEIQKEISTREDSAIQAGACFKPKQIAHYQFEKLTGTERSAWEPFACKFRGLLEPCSEPNNVYYKKCGLADIKKCAAGDEFKNCVDYLIVCPSRDGFITCSGNDPSSRHWEEVSSLPVNAVFIDDCTSFHKTAVAYGLCTKQ